MAPLTFKRRPKMRSWSPPTPPKPRRTWFYLWAVLAWFGAVAVGYRWAAIDFGSNSNSDSDLDDAVVATASGLGGTRDVAPATSADLQVGAGPVATAEAESSPNTAETAAGNAAPGASRAGNVILPCEEFLEQARAPTDSRLPAYLGRSVLDPFISDNDWARPCSGKHKRTVRLCVAVRDGSVVGLSARTSPQNLTFENCLREQAAKLALQPDSTLRVIQTTLRL